MSEGKMRLQVYYWVGAKPDVTCYGPVKDTNTCIPRPIN